MIDEAIELSQDPSTSGTAHSPLEAEDEALDLLLDELHHSSLKSSILDKESVHRVVSLLLEAEAAVEESPTTSGYGSADIQGSFQFTAMHTPKPHYTGIGFSCCFRGFLVTPIFLGQFLILTFLIMEAVRKKMGDGFDISTGGWSFLLGRLDCSC